jgi:potassium efflux system protein
MVVILMNKKMKQCCLTGIMIAVLAFLTMMVSPARAQDDPVSEKADVLTASLAEARKVEAGSLEKLKNQLAQVRAAQKSTVDKVNAYKIQDAIFSNQLIAPETPIKELEKSWFEIQGAERDLSERTSALGGQKSSMDQLLGQAQTQTTQTEKQIAEISPEEAAVSPVYSAILGQLQGLLSLQKEKQDVLISLSAIYGKILDDLRETRKEVSDLSARFDETIQKRKKEELLERQTSLVSIGLKQIVVELIGIPSLLLLSVSDRAFWAGQLSFAGSRGLIYAASFAVLLLILLGVIFRTRYHLVRLKDHPAVEGHYWNQLMTAILQKSVFLLGVTLFFYFYALFGPFVSTPPIVQTGLNIFLVWLFTAGCMDAVRIYCRDETVSFPKKPAFILRALITIVRWYGIIHVLLSWLGAGPSALTVWRLMFEISLYIGTIIFWNTVQKSSATEMSGGTRNLSRVIPFFKLLSFVIVFAPFILELFGYGLLSLYWLVSWGRTAVVALFSALTFLVLREWNPKFEKISESTAETADMPKNSIRWVVVQFLTMAWFGGVIFFLVLAWGGKQAVFLGIYKVLQHTYQVGTMRFSIMGFIVAILILLLTQAVARVWRQVFKEKILEQSGMEEGLKDSVTTITGYVIWSIGILIAFNAFGFNATSLTVVIGALGIGLGFGLQAIFNNFISGIILLFERPIQVGDDIEINGLWARVQKINVRSTVVQTYDNASIIIPNSDFISAQVTNWSFKDKRLRRNVSVGVAYGSDVELVRDTLMEVAEKTSRILRLPRPEVVFLDFGDSALIFKLRFWTRVEYFVTVETDVRFAINRLFKEKNIEIAFPQQDIHIRSGLKDEKPVSPQIDSPNSAGESDPVGANF